MNRFAKERDSKYQVPTSADSTHKKNKKKLFFIINTSRRTLFSKRSIQEHFDASPENVNTRNVFLPGPFSGGQGVFSFSPMLGNVKQMVHFVEVMAYLDTRAYVSVCSS